MIDEKKEVERLNREIAVLQSAENRLRSTVNNLEAKIEKLTEELERSKAWVSEQRDIANNTAGETASIKKILS
jgi:predicted  nucleic acid-binding Zn-ribbon protein